ncbi:MAG TPA: magnesium transporter [Limnochordales bacterium]|nr:magnesium transporter [Limnochordales bacterium]
MPASAAIAQRLHNQDFEGAKALLNQLSPTDAASFLSQLPAADRAVAFRLLDKDRAIAAFEQLTADEQRSLIVAMESSEASAIIEGLDPDDRAALFDELPAKVAKRLLADLRPETRALIHMLLNYPPDSAGRIMSPNYVMVRRHVTVAAALDAVRRSPLTREGIAVVFITDETRRYEGFVRLSDLVKAEPDTPVARLIEGADVRVAATDTAAAAARLLQRLDVPTVPVVDRENRLVGAVTFDDAMDVLEEESSETMYQKAGVAPVGQGTDVRSERLTRGDILYPVRVRIFFLLVTLAGGLAVGRLIERFENVLTSVAAAAVFIPMIMDMGGNVGTQSTTIFARGLALGHIDLSRFRRHLWWEVRVGMVMGAILGLIGGAIAYLWQGAPNGIPQLGIAVGVSLFISSTLACFLGFLMPWALVKLGLDHAAGADPFLTTLKDFTSLAIYFSLVVALLGLPG